MEALVIQLEGLGTIAQDLATGLNADEEFRLEKTRDFFSYEIVRLSAIIHEMSIYKIDYVSSTICNCA